MATVRRTYPDSVSLVRPPNTTMPKTLAALPRSQYATDLSLTSGKKLFLTLPPWIVLLREERGEVICTDSVSLTVPAVEARRVSVRKALRNGDLPGSPKRDRDVPFWHKRHINNCLENLGAASRSRGYDWKIEAMLKEQEQGIVEVLP